MPAFNAATIVEPLDYDFRTKDTPEAPHGTIREPNDRQISQFLAGLKKLVSEFQGKVPEDLMNGTTDVAVLLSSLDELDPEVIVQFHQSLAGLFSALCSGSPTKAELLKLSPRIRSIFYAWLQQEVMAPEAVPGGGNAQVVTMPQSAAG